MAALALASTFAFVSSSSGADDAEGIPHQGVAVMPSGAEFTIEVAATDRERQLGYMFREHVGPREGMLFVFDLDGHYGFWMKNCRVALDMLWLDEDWQVVHVAQDVPPCPEDGDCPLVEPLRAGRYVLEFAAGTARDQGLGVGDTIVFLSEPPLP
jgi:uncharacterized membrane protein (UPF0127 family)